MSKNLRDYTKTLYTLDAIVKRLDVSDWDKQSPNDDWTARQTLGHVIWGLKRITAAVRDDEPPAEQAEALVAGDQPAQTWAGAMDNLLEALDSRGVLDKSISTPFGEMTVDAAMGIFFTDTLTHAWDIAQSAGIDAALPEELADRGLKLLSSVGDALRAPGAMGPIIEADESAPVDERFIAFTGRQP